MKKWFCAAMVIATLVLSINNSIPAGQEPNGHLQDNAELIPTYIEVKPDGDLNIYLTGELGPTHIRIETVSPGKHKGDPHIDIQIGGKKVATIHLPKHLLDKRFIVVKVENGEISLLSEDGKTEIKIKIVKTHDGIRFEVYIDRKPYAIIIVKPDGTVEIVYQKDSDVVETPDDNPKYSLQEALAKGLIECIASGSGNPNTCILRIRKLTNGRFRLFIPAGTVLKSIDPNTQSMVVW